MIKETKSQEKIEYSKETLAIDIMHYKANSISFWLIILALALQIAMFLIIYKTKNCTPNYQLGIDLLVNVMFLLVAFLAAEKTKRYSKGWGYGSIVLGIIQVLRIFWIPLYFFLQYKNSGTGLETAGFIWCCVLLGLCGACLIVAGIITIKKYNTITKNPPLLDEIEAKKDVRT